MGKDITSGSIQLAASLLEVTVFTAMVLPLKTSSKKHITRSILNFTRRNSSTVFTSAKMIIP
jgi:hypothetical protein